MCDFGTLLTGLQLAGAGMRAYGTYQAGQAQAEGEDFRAKVLGINAGIADSDAALIRTQAETVRQGERIIVARGTFNEQKVADEGRKVLAEQRVTAVARNLDPTYGSPLLLQARTAGRVQADVELIRAGTDVERAEVKTRAANLEAQASGQVGAAFTARANQLMALRRASSARLAATLGAGTALLSGLTPIVDRYRRGNTTTPAGEDS